MEPLRDGRICITSVVHLAKVVTAENREEMLPRFFHRSRREAMEAVAAIRPAEGAPRRELVTVVRTRTRTRAADEEAVTPGNMAVAPTGPPAEPSVDPAHVAVQRAELTVDPAQVAVQPAELTVDPAQVAVQPAELTADPAQVGSALHGAGPSSIRPPAAPHSPTPPAPPPRPAPRDTAEPVTAELSRLHVTVSRRFLAKLEAARAALSHSRPGATAEAILEAGLDLVLAGHAKRKGVAAKPRKNPPPARTDRMPAHVRRAVWTRDGGRCQWPIEGGGICGSTLRVELDHVVPRARGGPSTIDNGRLLCALHNRHAARLAFGDPWMNRFARKTPEREPARPGVG